MGCTYVYIFFTKNTYESARCYLKAMFNSTQFCTNRKYCRIKKSDSESNKLQPQKLINISYESNLCSIFIFPIDCVIYFKEEPGNMERNKMICRRSVCVV